jgi:twitching motility protein PilT
MWQAELDNDRRQALEGLLRILHGAVQARASDVHLRANAVPRVRIRGRVLPLEHPALAEAMLETSLHALATHSRIDPARLKQKQFDFSCDLGQAGRFRVHAYRQAGTLAATLRHVQNPVPDLGSLRLPPIVKRLALSERGLLLVTGATGNGKSTTIAALLSYMNQKVARHVVTIEEPVEYVFQDQMCSFSQREIGRDVDSWHEALEGSLREDPDVLVVGETRTLEQFEVVLNAAESGRIVITTFHSSNVERAISRMVSLYPPEHQQATRNRIADALTGVVAQKLIPQKNKTELILVTEVLTRSPTVIDCVRDPARLRGLGAALEKGTHEYGSHSFDQVLTSLVKDGVVSLDTAKAHVSSASDFVRGMHLTGAA